MGTYADVINLLAGPLAELVAPRAARFVAPRHSVTASPRRRSPAPPLLHAAVALRHLCSAPPAPGCRVAAAQCHGNPASLLRAAAT